MVTFNTTKYAITELCKHRLQIYVIPGQAEMS